MMVNVPSAPVSFELGTLVSWLITVTRASGTEAPEESTTVPLTEAVGVWATSGSSNKNAAIAVNRIRIPDLLTLRPWYRRQPGGSNMGASIHGLNAYVNTNANV